VAEETTPIVELAEWLATPPGQYVLAWERAQFDCAVADVFGFHAVQVGLAEIDLLRNNRMPFKAYVGEVMPTKAAAAKWQGCAVANPEALPLAAQSVDLLILPHVFECTDEPHLVLREVERVLMPEGRVIISGFNPWSLWGARNQIPGIDPFLPHPPSAQVSLPRLKDWLKLLSFEVDRGKFGCYAPACDSEAWLNRWHFMEGLGQRWWGLAGSVYVVSAVKRVSGMKIIGPAWKKPRQSARVATAVAQARAARKNAL